MLSENVQSDSYRPLEQIDDRISPNRESAVACYLTGRSYPCGTVELAAIKLTKGDQLRKGGGAKRKNDDKSEMDKVTLTKSASRATKVIRQRALAMGADRMLTLTFHDNVSGIDEAWSCFNYFCKMMRDHLEKKGQKFVYVAVPEYQKRGAVHFHLAISGYLYHRSTRAIWRKAAGKRGGNIDITSPRVEGKKSWNPKRIANYLAKYLTKEDSVDFNRRRYSSGGKIQIPPNETAWFTPSLNEQQTLQDLVIYLVNCWSGKPVSDSSVVDSYFTIAYAST